MKGVGVGGCPVRGYRTHPVMEHLPQRLLELQVEQFQDETLRQDLFSATPPLYQTPHPSTGSGLRTTSLRDVPCLTGTVFRVSRPITPQGSDPTTEPSPSSLRDPVHVTGLEEDGGTRILTKYFLRRSVLY